MRRPMRSFGTLSIVVGVSVLAWAALVWAWQDPFTSAYTRWEQHKLEQRYDRLVAAYEPRLQRDASLAAVERELRTDARKFRKDSRRGEAIGRIEIPRMGVNMVLVNGTDHDSLTKGPGRDLRTFMPGEGELTYVAGHRTTYLAPFAHIDALRRGDRVTIDMPYATFVYAVTGHRIVAADELSVLKSHGRELLALQACHPRFFASHRYIAYARLVSVRLRGASTPVTPTALAAAAASD
jgi:sortase A